MDRIAMYRSLKFMLVVHFDNMIEVQIKTNILMS